MSSLLFALPDIYKSYASWIAKNPISASDYEVTAKWVSYFIAGRINNSHIVSELVYCLSNLLVLFNDRIIVKSKNFKVSTSAETIKLWLTVIEHCEVFCELSALKLWGTKGKWLIITIIQGFKCIARLLLVFHYNESIIQSPPIQVLDRKLLTKEKNGNCSYTSINKEFESSTFTLKSSGRVIRKVEHSPPINLRSWKPPENITSVPKESITEEPVLIKRALIAETIYIVKPIAHLVSLACCESMSWKPWLLSLAMDLTSLQLYRSSMLKTKLSQKQRLQLSRRTVMLILYLTRSPFYEKQSKDKIQSFITALSKNIPLAKLICNPFLQYLPFWQSCYFYMWST